MTSVCQNEYKENNEKHLLTLATLSEARSSIGSKTLILSEWKQVMISITTDTGNFFRWTVNGKEREALWCGKVCGVLSVVMVVCRPLFSLLRSGNFEVMSTGFREINTDKNDLHWKIF